jgi:hypothetical protein
MHSAQISNYDRHETHMPPAAATGWRPLIAGVVTGQVAGLVMAVVVMAVFVLFLGKGPLYPVQVIGSALLGESALQGLNVGAVLAGLFLHQAGPSLLWGALFGLYAMKAPDHARRHALAVGLGLGIVSMVGPYVLIPTVMNAMHGVDIWNREVPILWDWAAHFVFGAAFMFYPKVYARIARVDPA